MANWLGFEMSCTVRTHQEWILMGCLINYCISLWQRIFAIFIFMHSLEVTDSRTGFQSNEKTTAASHLPCMHNSVYQKKQQKAVLLQGELHTWLISIVADPQCHIKPEQHAIRGTKWEDITSCYRYPWEAVHTRTLSTIYIYNRENMSLELKEIHKHAVQYVHFQCCGWEDVWLVV